MQQLTTDQLKERFGVLKTKLKQSKDLKYSYLGVLHDQIKVELVNRGELQVTRRIS